MKTGAQKKLESAVPGRAMRLLMLYDLLLGQGKISGGGKAARAVKELKDPLAKLLAPVRAANLAATAAAEKGQGLGPLRYVRVNTLKTSVVASEAELEAFLAAAVAAAAHHHRPEKEAAAAATAAAVSVSVNQAGGGDGDVAAKEPLVWRDEHVAALLACRPPKGAEFFSHPRVKDGSWILQDKAR
jgi:hypothetical protein